MPAPSISDSEWTIMEVLWDHAPRTAAEVAGAVRRATGWADNTVRTMLSRLVEKRALHAAPGASGVRNFSPAVSRADCVRGESRSFMQRVFRGAASPLIAHFASQADLTPDEVAELKRVLDESLRRKN